MKIAFMISGTLKSTMGYRALSFGRHLVKKGHEVYVFAPRFDKYSKFKDEKIFKIDDIKIVRPWQPKTFSFELGLIPYIISSIFILFKLNPNVIYLFKTTPITMSGLFIKLIKRTPVILDLDDLDSKVMQLEENPPLKVKLVELSEKICLKYANAFTVASKYLLNLYSLQYKNKPITYIPNGAEFANSNISTIKLSSNRLVFVGNINRKNILEPFFFAIKNLKNQKMKIHAVIIGDGIYLNYFKTLTKKLNLSNEIKFLGRIPQDQLSKHLKVGDIGYSYMPNEDVQKACSNMKVFQYMQYGVISVVSNVGDLPLYTFNGKAGYIAKHSDITSLTEILKYALKDKKTRLNKINYALINAKKKYSWNILAQKVEQVYSNI